MISNDRGYVISSKHFSAEELTCQCGCGDGGMDTTMMTLLESLREDYGKPMPLSSAYRCPDHNDNVSGTGRTGPHTTRKAVDVLISGKDAYLLMKLAMDKGFTGIGVNQRGPHGKRFIHLDTILGGTRPWVWSY